MMPVKQADDERQRTVMFVEPNGGILQRDARRRRSIAVHSSDHVPSPEQSPK
jgi:hypothetical protein